MHLAHTTLAQFTLVRVTFIQIGDLHVVVQYTTGLATKKRQFVTDAGRIADRIGVRLAVVGWLITEAAPVDLAVGILAAEGCVIAQAFIVVGHRELEVIVNITRDFTHQL